MKKMIMAAIAAATLLSGCGSSSSTAVKYTITGCDSSFIDGQYMYIFTHNAGKAEWPDSALISNHSFVMEGELPFSTTAFLYMASGIDAGDAAQLSSSFIIENGTIRAENRGGYFLEMTGTPQNELKNRMYEMFSSIAADTSLTQPEIESAYDSITKSVILENRDALALDLLQYWLDAHSGSEVLSMLDSFPEQYRKHPQAIYLADLIKSMPTDIGRSYADIAGFTPEGDSLRLSDVVSRKGNRYLLLDFGALWCGPCRAEYPNLSELYKKYSSKGFEIFGVSYDSSLEAWQECIERFDMEWPQIHQGFGMQPRQTQAWKDYNPNGIPATFLIDCKTGTLIAKGLRGETLRMKIEGLLGK